jgi:hypothetical protein
VDAQARAEALMPMRSAPRGGTLIRLLLRDGGDFVGLYSDKWWGWIEFGDVWPLIRSDIRFAGWAPIDAAELKQIRQRSVIRPEQRVQRRSIEACPAKIVAAIVVTARKPRRR